MRDDVGIEPQGRRRVAWWVAAVAIVVAVVVVSWFRDSGGEPDDALLTGADFGSGYEVTVMTPEQLARAGAATDLPAGIEPAECAELLRARPGPTGSADATGVSAHGDRTAYLELVLSAGDVAEWDAGALADMVDTCRTTTFDDGDGTGTVEFSHLPAPVADGFAFAARVSDGDGVVTLGVAVSRVGAHVVVLTGAARGDLDRGEFNRLVAAADERVEARR